MGILAVGGIHHSTAVGKVLRKEVHGVPQVVAAPILPVLDDAVERHVQLAVFVHHVEQFAAALVAFLRLPVAEGPKGEHGHLAREMAHLGNHAVGAFPVHEVVVDGGGHFRGEGHALYAVAKEGRGVVVPKQPPALDALQYVLEVLKVRLLHPFRRVAAVHVPVLNGSQAVDGLILVEGEHLCGLPFSFVGTGGALFKTAVFLA